MSAHSIWLVEYGYVDRFPASNLFAAQPNEGFRRMPYCFGVIKTADECILVDAGFWDPAIHDRLTVKYGQTRWKPPAEVLGRTGIAPGDVGALLLTHNHFDHAGCAGEFAGAHVYIQREEIDRYRAALRLPPRFEFLTRNCEPELLDVLDAADRAGRLTLADGQHAVTDQISLLPAFDTHTAGSQYVLLEDEASGPWLFAGDNVYVYENIEGLRGDGVYAPISMATGSPSTWLTVTDEVLRSVGGATGRVLPFHDNAVWQRFPSREYSDGLHVAEVALAPGDASVLAHDFA